MKALQQKSEEERKQNISYESVETENINLKDKLRDLERRSQQDNLRFDGIAKYENESWCDTEENLKDLLYQRLNMQWILSNVSSLKGTGFFINDGYSKKDGSDQKRKIEESLTTTKTG